MCVHVHMCLYVCGGAYFGMHTEFTWVAKGIEVFEVHLGAMELFAEVLFQSEPEILSQQIAQLPLCEVSQ